MFTCEITKARSFACNFVYCEVSFGVSYTFNGENDNVVLESKIFTAKLFRF